MRIWNINVTVCCVAVLVFAGCEHEPVPGVPDGERPLYFTAGIASHASAGNTTRAWADDHINIMEEMDSKREELLKKTFTEGDVIRICNTKNDTEEPSFNLGGESSVYQYVWKKRISESGQLEGSDEEDEWITQKDHIDSYSEYLFEPDPMGGTDGTYGLYTNDLITDGGNYFQLYATWWREYQSGDNQNEPKIKTDQSTEDGFLNSDMMLAYREHSISMPYDPIRFVFWHVFAMLDVRITLPVLDKGHESTGSDDPEIRPSGYDTVEVSMTNIPTDYTIVHTGDLVSHAQLGIDANTASTTNEIPMYCYYRQEVPFEDYDSADEGSGKSLYRTYGFCGILPPMRWTQDQEIRPLLRVKLKDPVEGVDKYYTYTPDKFNSGGSSSEVSLTLTGGTISVVVFRMFRNMDDMEVVRGFIQPWTDMETSFKLTEEKTEKKGN